MSSAGLEPAIPAVRHLQTYNLDHTATEIGVFTFPYQNFVYVSYIRMSKIIPILGLDHLSS
jgi:hypothetical protein